MVFDVEEPFKVADLIMILLTLSFLPNSCVADSWYKKRWIFFSSNRRCFFPL